MSDQNTEREGPDLAQEGLAESSLGDGQIALGHANGEAVLLVRSGDDVFATGATCSHYGGPLAEGVFDGEGIRCPWHHACFSVRTGAASRPPALNPIDTYEVIKRGGRLFVGSKVSRTTELGPIANAPESVVIVGGGAAGNMAAQTLRAEGYAGAITLITADGAPPYDRPNLSKDYLAGTAPEEWLPLGSPDSYEKENIELLLGSRVVSLDADKLGVTLDRERRISAGAFCSPPERTRCVWSCRARICLTCITCALLRTVEPSSPRRRTRGERSS